MKKMIAAGSGIPLHFLAEPEGSTRTTAEAAGGPTYRHFEQRQRFFLWLLTDLLKVVVYRRSLVDAHVSRRAEVTLNGADISARDNVSLSLAAGNISSPHSTAQTSAILCPIWRGLRTMSSLIQFPRLSPRWSDCHGHRRSRR